MFASREHRHLIVENLSDYKGRVERQPHQAMNPACEQGFLNGFLISFIMAEVATFRKDKK